MASSQSTKDAIGKSLALFKGLNLAVGDVVEHLEVMTSEAHEKLNNLPQGVLAKNLFLKDKKKNNWLLTIRHDRKLNLGDLAKMLVSQRKEST